MVLDLQSSSYFLRFFFLQKSTYDILSHDNSITYSFVIQVTVGYNPAAFSPELSWGRQAFVQEREWFHCVQQ
jgi:hypothetical protein